jgi:1,2-dihydroxy-3-keto-5-methylthiopentene dioxygenase
MTILAVYQDEQLQIPGKVLTHTEDILPFLDAAGVWLRTTVPSWSKGAMISSAHALEISNELLTTIGVEQLMMFAEVLELEGPPGYEEDPAGEGQSEQTLAGDSLWLFIEGVATMCIHHGDTLLVLGCQCGDLLSLPQGVAHWAVPVTGRQSVIVRSARDAHALASSPTGNDIARRYPVLEL